MLPRRRTIGLGATLAAGAQSFFEEVLSEEPEEESDFEEPDESDEDDPESEPFDSLESDDFDGSDPFAVLAAAPLRA